MTFFKCFLGADNKAIERVLSSTTSEEIIIRFYPEVGDDNIKTAVTSLADKNINTLHIDVSNTSVTDKGIKYLIDFLLEERLRIIMAYLYANNINITDETLKNLMQFFDAHNLVNLSLSYNSFSSAALMSFCEKIEDSDVCELSIEGVENFKYFHFVELLKIMKKSNLQVIRVKDSYIPCTLDLLCYLTAEDITNISVRYLQRTEKTIPVLAILSCCIDYNNFYSLSLSFKYPSDYEEISSLSLSIERKVKELKDLLYKTIQVFNQEDFTKFVTINEFFGNVDNFKSIFILFNFCKLYGEYPLAYSNLMGYTSDNLSFIYPRATVSDIGSSVILECGNIGSFTGVYLNGIKQSFLLQM